VSLTITTRDTAPPPSPKAAPSDAKTGLSERAKSERRLGLLLCTPAIIAMVAVTAYPIGYAIWLSLQRYDLRFPDQREFVGLANYQAVLTSDVWWQALFNTVLITVISVVIELVIGFAIAMLLHRAVFGRGLARASVLIPYGIVTVVAALAWRYAFDPTTGFVNQWLGLDTAWFASRPTAIFVIVLTEVWKTVPFMALLLLAGLTLVPQDVVNAARVDGAGAWTRFWRVRLPLMKGAVLVALLFRTLDAFRIFDTIYVQTRGAENTESVSLIGYNTLITRLNLGIGSAVSILIFICVIVIAALFVKGFGASLADQEGGSS
jgi:multiple sugar transport system permease protein